jgi:hemolysin type calcium-binding protein
VGRRLYALIVVLLAALPSTAGAHSLVRVNGTQVNYLSSDATSLNTLVVRMVGGDVEMRDPTVDGGMDPGPCRPGEITNDANSWIIQTFCPRGGADSVRIDVGEREDTVTVAIPLRTTLLGGPGADRLQTGDPDDAVAGNQGNDILGTGGGNDQAVGGEGDDRLDGAAGNDVLDGGLGVDNATGGTGNDDVRVRDGLADTVRCGEGTDKVDADTLDEVAEDCERITRTPTAPPPDAGTSGTDTTKPVLEVGAATLQRLGTIKIAATSSERGFIAASGSLTASGLALPIQASRKRVAVAGGGVELRIKLKGRALKVARRAVRRKRKVTLRMGVVATDAAGNSSEKRAPAIRLRR